MSKELASKTDEEKKDMKNVSYSLAIESFIYAMDSIGPYIEHIVGVVIRFMSHLPREGN